MNCLRCGRQLKNPTPTGMGRVCAARSQALKPEVVDRDLFGYDLERAVRAARERIEVVVGAAVARERIAVRQQFQAVRADLLGWRA